MHDIKKIAIVPQDKKILFNLIKESLWVFNQRITKVSEINKLLKCYVHNKIIKTKKFWDLTKRKMIH